MIVLFIYKWFFCLFVYGIHTECLGMMWHHASSLLSSGLGEKKFLDFQLVNIRFFLKSFPALQSVGSMYMSFFN